METKMAPSIPEEQALILFAGHPFLLVSGKEILWRSCQEGLIMRPS